MFWKAAVAAMLTCALSACGTTPATVFAEPPTLGTRSESTTDLLNLPGPNRKIYAAVYAFQDLTGQHRPNDNYADYSFAVTQGGAPILINALRDAGAGRWFAVLERNRLGDLLQERQIIRANRQENVGPNGKPLEPLGPLLNAGVLMEGGIVGYDTNVLTGGAGATYLGIGGNAQYRRDAVEVYLRAVSVLTGEVLAAVTTEKTVYSTGLSGSINKYVSFNKLLQVEAGFTTNEPVQIAVRQAIEKAVYSLVLEGAMRNLWSFADGNAQRQLLADYRAERDTVTTQPPLREEDAPPTPSSAAPNAPPQKPPAGAAKPPANFPLQAAKPVSSARPGPPTPVERPEAPSSRPGAPTIPPAGEGPPGESYRPGGNPVN